MIVRRLIVDTETDWYDIEKRVGAARNFGPEIVAGVKMQLVGSRLHQRAAQQRQIAASVVVRPDRAQMCLTLALDAIELDTQVLGRFATGRIQHMGRQTAVVSTMRLHASCSSRSQLSISQYPGEPVH